MDDPWSNLCCTKLNHTIVYKILVICALILIIMSSTYFIVCVIKKELGELILFMLHNYAAVNKIGNIDEAKHSSQRSSHRGTEQSL